MVKNRLCTFVGAIALLTTASFAIPDEKGVDDVDKGSNTTESLAWYKIGDMRLVNNDWGTQHPSTNCSHSEYSIFVEDNGSFGWTFDRWGCGGNASKPDYPEIEFGIHPFGTSKHLVTTPDYSSTDLIPKKLSEIESFTIDIDNYRIDIQDGASWNLNVEMWFTEDHPVTGSHKTAHSELMLFFGWNSDRWGWDGPQGNLNISGKGYDLIVNKPQWPPGQAEQWKYFQFRQQGGPFSSYSGKLDVKEAIDWLRNQQGFSENLWISRVELGTEIDDGTKGKVTIDNITWEVNGEKRGVVFAGEEDPWESGPEPSSSEEAPESSSEVISSSEAESSSEVISSSEIESSSEAVSSSKEESSSEEEIESSSEEEPSEDTSPLFEHSTITQGLSVMYRVSGNSAISLTISEAGMYSVNVYDVMGNVVATYNNQILERGAQHLPLNASVGDGLYLIQATPIK